MNYCQSYLVPALLFISLLSGLSYLLFPEDCCTLLQIIYILQIVLVLLISRYKLNSFVNSLTLFLFFVLFFNGSRIILDLLGYDNMRELYFFSTATITESNNNRSILVIIVGVTAVTLGYLLYKEKNAQIITTKLFLPNIIMWFLLIAGFAAHFYLAYQSFSLIMTLSYQDYFTTGIDRPFYIRITSYLPLLVCFCKLREGKTSWIYPIFLYSLLSMATGQRGPGLLLIAISLYYCIKKGLIKINIIKILTFISVMFLLAVMVGEMREDKEEEGNNYFAEFLWGQGISISVLQLSIQEYEKLDYNFFNLFGNIMEYTRNYIPENDEKYKEPLTALALKYKVWSKYISYKVDSVSYYLGGGLGGNYFGQSFVIGKELFVIFVSFIFGIFLHFVEYEMFNKGLICSFLSFVILQSLLYIPRDNLMDFATDVIDPLFISIVFAVLNRIARLILVVKY